MLKVGLWSLLSAGGFECRQAGEPAFACMISESVYSKLLSAIHDKDGKSGPTVSVSLGDTVVLRANNDIRNAIIYPPGANAEISVTRSDGLELSVTGPEMFWSRQQLSGSDGFDNLVHNIDSIMNLALASPEGSRFPYHLVGQAVLSNFVQDFKTFDMSISLSDLGRHVRFQAIAQTILASGFDGWDDYPLARLIKGFNKPAEGPRNSISLKDKPVFAFERLHSLTMAPPDRVWAINTSEMSWVDTPITGSWVNGHCEAMSAKAMHSGGGYDRIEFEAGAMGKDEPVSLVFPTVDRVFISENLKNSQKLLQISPQEVPSPDCLKKARILRDRLLDFDTTKALQARSSAKHVPAME